MYSVIYNLLPLSMSRICRYNGIVTPLMKLYGKSDSMAISMILWDYVRLPLQTGRFSYWLWRSKLQGCERAGRGPGIMRACTELGMVPGWQPRGKWRPQSYICTKLNSANNHVILSSRKECSPAITYIAVLWDPKQKKQLSSVWLLTHRSRDYKCMLF